MQPTLLVFEYLKDHGFHKDNQSLIPGIYRDGKFRGWMCGYDTSPGHVGVMKDTKTGFKLFDLHHPSSLQDILAYLMLPPFPDTEA